jgi:hypothetical protein
MRLIERHQIRDEALRVVGGNDLPTSGWRVAAGELEGLGGRFAGDETLFIKKTIGRHVRVDRETAR